MPISLQHISQASLSALTDDLAKAGTPLKLDSSPSGYMRVAINLDSRSLTLKNADGTESTVFLSSTRGSGDLVFQTTSNTLNIPVYFKPTLKSHTTTVQDESTVSLLYYKVQDLDSDGDEDVFVFFSGLRGAYVLLNGSSSLLPVEIPSCNPNEPCFQYD